MVVTACMFGSSERGGLKQHPHPWHFRAGGGAVHSIKSGHCARRRPCPLLFAGPAAPDRGSQRGRNDCASSCLMSAARDGGTGAASASYWSLNERPIAASPT